MRVDGTEVTITEFQSGSSAGIYWLTYNEPEPDGQLHVMDVSVLNLSDQAFHDHRYTTCDQGGCTEIFNNEIVELLCGLEGSWRCFYIDVPPNQAELTVDTWDGTGDLDLFVRHEEPASTTEYDHRPALGGNTENVTIENPPAGRYWIGTYGNTEYLRSNLRAAYRRADLDMVVEAVFTDDCPTVVVRVHIEREGQPVTWLETGDFTLFEDGLAVPAFSVEEGEQSGDYLISFVTDRADGQTHTLDIGAVVLGDSIQVTEEYDNCYGECAELQNNEVVPGLDGRAGSWRCFFIDVPADFDVFEARTWAGLGDSEIYVKRGAVPTPTDFDYTGGTAGTEEMVQVLDPPEGRYFIAIQGFTEYTDVNLMARYYNLGLGCVINTVSISGCPVIEIDITVSTQDGPVTGLTAGDFTIREFNEPDFAPDEVDELGGGRYLLRYTTARTDGSEVILTVGVSYLGQSISEIASFENCLRTGPAVEVWINEDHAGPAGIDVAIPVLVGPVSAEADILEVELEIKYDADVLEFLELDAVGSMTETWDLFDDTQSLPGCLRITLADFGTDVLNSDAEEAPLIYLRFHVDDDALPGQCSPLEFPPGTLVFNEGEPTAVTMDGMFCVTAFCPGAVGDVDGDGDNDEAFDALQVLRDIIDIPTVYDPIPPCVADTNCSGVVTLVDAVYILQKTIFLIEEYCSGETPKRRAPSPFEIEIPMPGDVAAGEPFELTIVLSEQPFGQVYGYSFDLVYDQTRVNFTGEVGQSDTLTSRWGPPGLNLRQGRMSIYHLNPLSPMNDTGPLIRLTAVVGPGTESFDLTFENFQLAEDSEPVATLGPITVPTVVLPCFDQDQYRSAVADWSEGTTDIRDILGIIACLAQ